MFDVPDSVRPAKDVHELTVLLDEPLAERLFVFFHPGESLEVALHVALGFFFFDAQLEAQAGGAHAVDEAEVDGLGNLTVSLVSVVKDTNRCLGVHVVVVGEDVEQLGVAAVFSENPHLHLGVISKDAHKTIGHHEGFSD